MLASVCDKKNAKEKHLLWFFLFGIFHFKNRIQTDFHWIFFSVFFVSQEKFDIRRRAPTDAFTKRIEIEET